MFILSPPSKIFNTDYLHSSFFVHLNLGILTATVRGVWFIRVHLYHTWNYCYQYGCLVKPIWMPCRTNMDALSDQYGCLVGWMAELMWVVCWTDLGGTVQFVGRRVIMCGPVVGSCLWLSDLGGRWCHSMHRHDSLLVLRGSVQCGAI